LEKTGRYTKNYERLKKRLDKAAAARRAAWRKSLELRNKSLRAKLEDAAEQTENPALAVAARWGLREAAEDAYARGEERERVYRQLVELMRLALTEAIAAEGDGAGLLPAAIDKEVIESVLQSMASDAMSNPLLIAKDMVDRLRSRLRGERIRRYQSLKVLELEGEGEEVGGYVRKIHETFDFERVDQIVAEAKAKREEARERERRTAAAAEAQARANADALTGLETKGVRVTDEHVWSGNRVADDSTFVSDGRSLVDTRHVGKDDAGRLRKKDKTWGGPPASHSRVAEVWRKSTDDPGGAAQFLGVDPEGDHAFFRLKSGELLAVPPEQVAYFSRVVAPDEWRAKGHDSPLVGMKKGKPAVVIMPITGKKWVAIEYPLDVARAAARGLTIGPQETAEPSKRAKRRVDDRGHAAQRGQPPPPPQLQVAPDQVSSSMAKTEDGKKLLDRLVQDSKKGTKGAYRVGRRSIFEALAQMLHSRIVVARSQTTKKRPGKYLPVPHLWFTKSGTDAPTNLHEAGHALLTYLADQQALPTDFLNALESFAEAQMPPNGYASAVDPHEGMAEMLRLWVQEPDAIPGDLRAEFERIARERLPGLMDGMEDVRLAYRFHENRDPMQQLQSSVLDRPRGAGRISRAKAAFFEAAYNLLGSSPGWSYIERGIWRAMTKSPEAIGRRVRRKMQQATREIMRSLDDTPADVLTYRSILYELESVISHAVHGTNPETKGIRVHLLEHWDTIFGEGEVAEAAIQKLRDAGIDVPESVPFGHFLTVHDRSIADTKAAVGDENWQGFLTYGQWRTALYRHERLGHDYPLMDRFPPGVLSEALKTMEGEHPDWPAHYKAVQKIQDQSLLLDVLSGERTIDEVVRMKKAHEDYWTLPRAVEHRAGSTAPGGQHPSSGIRPTKGGSLLPFLGEGDVVAEKVRRAVTAYYDIAAKRSLLRLQEQMRNHKRWKDLPFSGRKYVESLMVPLKMDIKLAATLGPAELQEMFADAINGYLEREAGRPLLDEEKIAPGDVELDEQFRPVFRGTPPRMARVLSLFDPKTPGKRQYYYVPDPLVFDLQVGRGGTLPDWAMNILAMGAEVTAPWRRAKTQNWVFTLGNVPRDIATNVLIGEGFIPGGDHAVGLVHEILGSDEAEMLATEMMSRSIQGVTHEQHRGVWGSFVETATEGIVIPGYREMTPGQKAMRIPGQISSTVFKSVELPNWALFGQWASQKSERLGRHGAFHRARGRGASPLRAQRSLATDTGHFSQHSNTRAVAQAYRWAGFANPHLQIMWQIFDRATHPDPRVRAAFWAVRVPMLAGVGVGLAALTYLGWTLWYRDKDELEKRLQRERERTTWDRTRYFHVGPMKFPFESGLPGGVMSATYVLTMDKLLNHEGDRSVLATSVMQKLRETPGLIPPHILPAAEVALDYSFFFDREVVHPALRSQHPDVPYLQTWDDTPTPYKVAAEWMDSLPDFMKASPEQLRYLVRSMVDSLADDLIAAAGRAIDGDAPAKVLLGNEWADMPMFGRRVVREPRGYGSQPVVDLRKAAKEFDALRDKIADLRHRGVSPERVSELQEQATQFEFTAMMSDVVNDLFREAKENRKAKNLDEARAVEREMTEAAVLFFRMVENKLDSKEVREKVMPPLLRKLTAKVERAFVAPPRKQREGEKAPRMRIGETEGAFEVRKSLWEKTGQPESDESYAAYLETWKQARDDDRAFFVRYRDTPVVRQALEQVRSELRRKKPQMPARDTEESIQAWRRRRAVWSQKYRRLQEILGER